MNAAELPVLPACGDECHVNASYAARSWTPTRSMKGAVPGPNPPATPPDEGRDSTVRSLSRPGRVPDSALDSTANLTPDQHHGEPVAARVFGFRVQDSALDSIADSTLDQRRARRPPQWSSVSGPKRCPSYQERPPTLRKPMQHVLPGRHANALQDSNLAGPIGEVSRLRGNRTMHRLGCAAIGGSVPHWRRRPVEGARLQWSTTRLDRNRNWDFSGPKNARIPGWPARAHLRWLQEGPAPARRERRRRRMLTRRRWLAAHRSIGPTHSLSWGDLELTCPACPSGPGRPKPLTRHNPLDRPGWDR